MSLQRSCHFQLLGRGNFYLLLRRNLLGNDTRSQNLEVLSLFKLAVLLRFDCAKRGDGQGRVVLALTLKHCLVALFIDRLDRLFLLGHAFRLLLDSELVRRKLSEHLLLLLHVGSVFVERVLLDLWRMHQKLLSQLHLLGSFLLSRVRRIRLRLEGGVTFRL